MSIYVWGTGCGAGELVSAGLAADRIAAFIDNHPFGPTFLGRPVLVPDQFDAEDCSLMIVSSRHSDAIAAQCRALGLPDSKILFLKNTILLSDRNASCTHALDLLDKNLYDNLLPKHRIIPVPSQLKTSILPESEQTNDYVRLATLELLCRRLSQVPGAVAELGVYKGGFARCINRLLSDRKLYLFDSFEGFAPEEGKKEQEDGHCTEAFLAAHQNTNVQKVLAHMPYPEQVVMRQGFFPETAQGLSETFCLVSLDVDLEETTYAGLQYFWPRLAPGGYLLLHDWDSPRLAGVANALSRFEKDLGAPLPAVPVPDVGGTLVLLKPYKNLLF